MVTSTSTVRRKGTFSPVGSCISTNIKSTIIHVVKLIIFVRSVLPLTNCCKNIFIIIWGIGWGRIPNLKIINIKIALHNSLTRSGIYCCCNRSGKIPKYHSPVLAIISRFINSISHCIWTCVWFSSTSIHNIVFIRVLNNNRNCKVPWNTTNFCPCTWCRFINILIYPNSTANPTGNNTIFFSII